MFSSTKLQLCNIANQNISPKS